MAYCDHLWEKSKLGTKRDFRDRVVVITGAAGGIGRALSRRFARAGARLALTDRDGKGVKALAEELVAEGTDCFGFGLDVTDEAACNRIMEAVAKRFGRLDVLINNAGITHRSAFARTASEVYRRVMEVNYFGSLYCTKACLDYLIENKGLIVVISSIAGFSPLLGRTGYSASKHALHGLFDSLRAELREKGVGVTIVCPGFTATNIYKSALDGDGSLTSHPQSTVGVPAAPESVAEAVFRAATRGKRLKVLSNVGRLTRILNKFFPGFYERKMARTLRSELDGRE
jgi:NAD(P)-dependent dehydrogenase (short-subunit alcohol dehydrogenase family)